MAELIKVRARKTLFHGGTRVYAGDVFKVTSEQLAETLGEHVAAVQWRSGDILLIDNTRVLHDGLPGFGPLRKLHVALLASDE